VRLRRRTDRRGGAALEFALTLPILALVLSGIMEYSFYVHQKAMFTTALGEAARHASLDALNGREGEIDPSVRAASYLTNLLSTQGFDCEQLNCEIEATLRPGQVATLELRADYDYEPVASFPGLPIPDRGSVMVVFPIPDIRRD